MAKTYKKPKVVKVTKIKKVAQTRAGKLADQKRQALPPGVRRSKSGRFYSERRSNRSD